MSAVAGVKRSNTALGEEHLSQVDAEQSVKRAKVANEKAKEEPASSAEAPKVEAPQVAAPKAIAVTSVHQLMNSGRELQGAKLLVDAIRKFHEVIASPDATHAMKISAWTYIGYAHGDIGQSDQAVGACREAYKVASLLQDAQDLFFKISTSCNLSDALITRGGLQDMDESIKILLPLLQKLSDYRGNPEHVVSIYLNLVSAHLKRNRDGDAAAVVHFARIALAMKCDDPDTRGWLLCDQGDAKRYLNSPEQALRCYAEGMELYPKLSPFLKTRIKERFENALRVQINAKLEEQSKLVLLGQTNPGLSAQIDKLNEALKKAAQLK